MLGENGMCNGTEIIMRWTDWPTDLVGVQQLEVMDDVKKYQGRSLFLLDLI